LAGWEELHWLELHLALLAARVLVVLLAHPQAIIGGLLWSLAVFDRMHFSDVIPADFILN
jgi:hypothetical protein